MVHPRLKHIEGLGEMGRLISNHDWSRTPVGDPGGWPCGLIVTLGTMLGNKIGCCLFWGTELVEFYNDAYIPVLGSKHPGALGGHPAETWPEIHDQIKQIYGDVFQGKTTYYYNWPLTVDIGHKKEERYYTFSLTPVLLEDGTIGGGLATVMETTAEVRATRRLEQSERNFRNYQEFSPVPFFSLTEDWRLSYMNPACVKNSLAPVKIEDMIGKYWYDVWPATKDSVFHEQYKKVMKGQIVDFEAIYVPYGRWYHVFAFPLYPGVGVFAHDVTVSKNIQSELEEAVASRDRFLSIASHELNTPITSLKLHTQMMERMLPNGVPPERLGKFFEQTDDQIGRLGQLVGDMLDASRIREGRFSLNFEKCDLHQVVADTVEHVGPLFQAAGHVLPVLKVEGKDFTCYADDSRIEQVVSNLLINACKYGGDKLVKVTLTETENEILIAVKDQGPGIPEENRERIFEQYFRGTQAKGEGLGLGLFIARQIAAGHQGNIWVESPPEGGATFYFKLPRSK